MSVVFVWAGSSRLCSHYAARQLLRLAAIQKRYQIGLMFTHIRTVISAHVSNTLDQIPENKVWTPKKSSGKMKPEVQSSVLLAEVKPEL